MKLTYLLVFYLLFTTSLVSQDRKRSYSKVAYINYGGEVVIEPQFDRASLFKEGYAAVEINKKYFIINKEGEIVLSPDYDFVSFKRVDATFWGLKKEGNKRTWFRFNAKGEILFQKEAYFIWPTSTGLFGFETKEGYGYMNQDMKVAIAPAYESGSEFSQGLARVKSQNMWGYIDTQGNWVIPPKYDETTDFKDGYAVGMRGGKTYIYDVLGNETAEIKRCNRIYLAQFSEGVVALKDNMMQENYYYLPDGSRLFDKGFYRAGTFINGIARIREKEGRTYYINKKGERISDFYLNGGHFENGRASVTTERGTGMVNEQFEFVLPDKYVSCTPFQEGLSAVYLYLD